MSKVERPTWQRYFTLLTGNKFDVKWKKCIYMVACENLRMIKVEKKNMENSIIKSKYWRAKRKSYIKHMQTVELVGRVTYSDEAIGRVVIKSSMVFQELKRKSNIIRGKNLTYNLSIMWEKEMNEWWRNLWRKGRE